MTTLAPARLRAWRLAHKMSQDGLARRLRVNQNRIHTIETGQAVPDARLADELHREAGIPVAAWKHPAVIASVRRALDLRMGR